MKTAMRSIAVIPVHNEAPTIAAIVAAARAYLPVLVVDDASNDGSGALAVAAGAGVLTCATRRGKGGALQCGFAEALRRGADFVVTLDGDGQHDPQDIPRLLAVSQRWPQHLIIGGRLANTGAIPRHRLYAIQVASFWLNWLGNCNIRDTQSGFRVYPAALLRACAPTCGGFLLESEIILQASQAGWQLREVPIGACYPPHQRSHYCPLRDGTAAACYLLYHGLRFWPSQLKHYRCDRRWLRRRTRAAALAMAVLPVLMLSIVVQVLVGRLGLDVLAPVIRRFYDQRTLHHTVSETWHDRQQARL